MAIWDDINTYAKHWVLEAGKRIRDSFSKELLIQTKSNPDDLVTNIDKETEQFFIRKISHQFPSHQILGEEGLGDEVSSLSGVVWIIDPIDGTMNFVHQQRNFAISVAVFEDGVGKIGIIYDVVNDELFHAARGAGAYVNGLKIKPLSETPINEAIIGINATWLMENKRIDHHVFVPLVKAVRGTRSYGSAALEIAYVVTGRLDAYISMRLSPWDVAAGAVIIGELGGVVTNLRGEKLDFLSKDSLLAAKPGLHPTIINDYLKEGKW